MKLKQIVFLLLALTAPVAALHAQEPSTPSTSTTAEASVVTNTARAKLINSNAKVFTAGVMLGTDIGGAIPVPFRYIPSTFNPYPQLNLDLGVFAEFRLHKHWSLGANLIYKTVGMKADARVDNQKYEDTQEHVIQYFTGTANMDMKFTMLEVPIYAKYTFNNQVSKLLFGGYFAYNIKAEFNTIATKGYAGDTPGKVEVVIKPGDDPINMEFSHALSNFDGGLMVGYEHTIYNRLNIGIRLSMGLSDIFRADTKYFDYRMLQMRGSILISYRIFN